jgi:hypothetical protein
MTEDAAYKSEEVAIEAQVRVQLISRQKMESRESL